MRKRFKRRKLFFKKYVLVEKRKTRMFIFILVWGILFAWLVKSFVFSLVEIKGDSMSPVFQQGDFQIVSKFIYFFKKPEKGEVVVIKNIWLKEDQLIKRIIGIPGDIIEIRDGDVYLNGQFLDEPYAKGKTYPDIGAFRIKENMYFVMGDNREFSYDSRHSGPVKRSEIRGKVTPDQLFALR